MKVFKRRSRTVTFRLSQEEYETLRQRCISEGARSISDFARASACRFRNGVKMRRKDLETEVQIQMLRELVSDLDRQVRRLSQILDAVGLPKQAVEGVAAAPSGCTEERQTDRQK